MTEMKMTLLENTMDFLLEAVEQLSDPNPTPRHIKYAIVHLSNAIELLLKQRLYTEHWTLIFFDVNKASKRALASGDFKSISVNHGS